MENVAEYFHSFGVALTYFDQMEFVTDVCTHM